VLSLLNGAFWLVVLDDLVLFVAKCLSGLAHFVIFHLSFKNLAPGGINLGLIGSTCTALPCTCRAAAR